MRASSVLPKPSRPGQTVGGRYVVPFLDVGELVLLELLTRYAARGAEAEGKHDLAAEIAADADHLRHHLSQRAALATGEVAGNA